MNEVRIKKNIERIEKAKEQLQELESSDSKLKELLKESLIGGIKLLEEENRKLQS